MERITRTVILRPVAEFQNSLIRKISPHLNPWHILPGIERAAGFISPFARQRWGRMQSLSD
jgi:hypothetical protein